MRQLFLPVKCFTILLVFAMIGALPASASRIMGTVSIRLHLAASAAKALDAFTPLAEERWNPGWEPQFSDPQHPNSEGSVFTTGEGTRQVVWLLDSYSAAQGTLRYFQVMPSRWVSQIEIRVRTVESDTSVAIVTYHRTSISAQGDTDALHFLAHFPYQQAHWEAVLNDYLKRTAKQ